MTHATPRFFAARRLFAALSVLSLSFLVGGCQPSDAQPHGGMPPPEVSVTTITPVTVPVTFEYVGQTAGSREVEVRARVTGILQKRNFVEGERVAQGQSLFALDSTPFQLTLDGAEAALAGADARLTQARHNAARLKPLYAAKAASQKEYDDAVSAEAIADAELKGARARLDEAKLNLTYSRVIAPVSGIAGRALRSEGNYVSGPEVLLTSVVQIDPIYVLFGITDEERLKLQREVDAGRLTLPKDGRFEVTVKLADGQRYDKTGKLNFTDVRIDNKTGTSETRAELPNPASVLRPGQFVRVTLSGAQRHNAILVPQRAVLQGPQGRFVYSVNAQSQAEIRPVTVGEWSGDAWLIERGLQAGDKVIVDGVMKIGPGAPVRIADIPTVKK